MALFSIVIITYNEEDYIEECLDALTDLSDDIIVIDAMSTDRTVEICKSKPIHFIQKRWEGYGVAKNYGASIAKYDWVLSIDADEVCTAQLSKSLNSLEYTSDQNVYLLHRINHIGSRAIGYGHLHPEWKPRLFHKEHYKWNNAAVHEQLTQKPKLKIKMKGDLLHYQANNLDELELSYRHYANLSKRNKPILLSAFQGTISALYHFIRSFFLMRGFFEGKFGFELAVSRGKLGWWKWNN